MTTEDESALLERVFLRIGMADTDEQLQTALGKFLVPVLVKLNSPSEQIRKKVMELLVHINKRLKSLPKIQLPMEALIGQYRDPTATVMIMNFSIIYIKMGYPRLEPVKRAELVPLLIQCMEGKAEAQQASLLQLVIPALEHIKFPSDKAKSCSMFGLSAKPQLSKLILDYMMDMLLLTYSSNTTAVERAAQSARQPRGSGLPPAPAPPCLSDKSFKHVTGDNPLTAEDLEKANWETQFLGAEIFKEEEVVCHYVIAAADTRHSVATAADMELKRIMGSIDWNNVSIVSKLYSLFQGTMAVKGKPAVKPEEKRMPACRRIRLKVFPFFLKSRKRQTYFQLYSGPKNSNGFLTCLYGKYKCQIEKYGCPVCASHLFEKILYLGLDIPSCRVVIYYDDGKAEPQARMMAVQYASSVFPPTNVASRYVLLLASGDVKEDIRLEARKSLNSTAVKKGQKGEHRFPSFIEMTWYIKEKGDSRVTSQNRYVSGNHTIPFNPVTYGQILLYLRSCLSSSAGVVQDDSSISEMQIQAPVISKYISSEAMQGELLKKTLQVYVDFAKQLLIASGGAPAIYCLLEMVAMATDRLASQFIQQLDWIKSLVFSSKDDIRDYAAQLYAIVLHNQGDGQQMVSAIEEFTNNIPNTNQEKQNGSTVALGYLIGRLLKDSRQSDEKVKESMLIAIKKIVWTLTSVEEPIPLLTSGACIALGEIGRTSALPLPTGAEGDSKEEVTKLSLVNTLINIVKTGREIIKTKERAALCLGYLCVGDQEFPHRRKVVQDLMEAVQAKQVELHFTISESLVCAAQGAMSCARRDLWTEPEEFKVQEGDSDDIEWYTGLLLSKYVQHVNPHIRQAACIWLLSLVKKCSAHKSIQGKMQQIQGAFMKLISESDEVTQDIASKGLGMVYEKSSAEVKDSLVSNLVDTLMTGKRAKVEVTSDTQVFSGESLGKTPDGGGLTTYKELCSIANDLNQPDLIYKFMHLANHNAMWNSKKGAAFGFTTIAAQAGEQLAPYLSQIVPRLYRYQFDPNPKIQQAMSSIWNALVQNNKDTVYGLVGYTSVDCPVGYNSVNGLVGIHSLNVTDTPCRRSGLDTLCRPSSWLQSVNGQFPLDTLCRTSVDKSCRRSGLTTLPPSTVHFSRLVFLGGPPSSPCTLSDSASLFVNIRSFPRDEMVAFHFTILTILSFCYAPQGSSPVTSHRLVPLPHSVGYTEGLAGVVPLESLTPSHAQCLRTVGIWHEGVSGKIFFFCKMNPSLVSSLIHYHNEYISVYTCADFVEHTSSFFAEEALRHACGQTLFAVSHHSPDILKRHAAQALPLAFFAMHEKKDDGESVSKSDEILSAWEEVWIDSTPGSEAGIKLYLTEIVELSQECLESQSWKTKAQAAAAMSTVASKLGSDLGPPHLGSLLTALLTGLQGRTWSGKECLLQATQEVCVSCNSSIFLKNEQNYDNHYCHFQVVDAVTRECKKEKLDYKLRAIECLGHVLEAHSIDRFQELWEIVHPVLDGDEKNGKKETSDDDDKKPQQKHKQLECYYEALGQSWPKFYQHKVKLYQEKFCTLLMKALPTSPWKIQVVILKATHKFLERLCAFQDKEKFDQYTHDSMSVIQKSLASVLPCLGNMKYTVIRAEALAVIELAVNKLTGLGRMENLSPETRETLITGLSSLDSDSSPELKDKSSDLKKLLVNAMETT
ncbi:hypothetical protein ScPMuIL_006173 [Solemya velum]